MHVWALGFNAAKAAAKNQKATIKLQKHQKQQDRTQQQSSRSSKRCSKNNTTTKAQKKTCKPLGLHQKDPGERVHGRSGHVKRGAADTGPMRVDKCSLSLHHPFGALFFAFGPHPSGPHPSGPHLNFLRDPRNRTRRTAFPDKMSL